MGLSDGLEFVVGLDMSAAERGLRTFAGKARAIGSAFGSVATAAAAIGATMGAGLAAGAVALNSIMQAGGQMESFESRLTTLMGSATEARARMGELFAFASSTPFELDQIVGAEVTLRGFGAAAEELLPGLIDFAATTGTDMSQAAIDFGKAWNQGATGLESDGGRILRRQIEIREGMDATKMGIEDFRAAMLETLSEGMFAGGADRLSQTFQGMTSNLIDEWSRFKLAVADAGVFNNVKGALAVTLDLIGDNRKEAGALADVVSRGLWGGFKLAAQGVALVIDYVQALRGGISLLVAGWHAGLNAIFTGQQKVTQAMADAASALGADGVAKGYQTQADALGMAAREAGILRDEAVKTAVAIGMQGSAIPKVNALLAEAEAKAKGFGSAIEDIASGQAPAEPAGGGGESDDAAKRAQDDLAREFEAAMSFSENMAALGQSDLERERAQYAERMGMLLQYQQEGLISGQLFADTRVAIEEDYAARVGEIERAADEERSVRAREYVETTLGLYAGLLGSISGLIEDGNAKEKTLAKALAVSEIGINTGVAIAKTFAQFGWPLGIAPAAAMAAQGAIQAAKVAKAHQGHTLSDVAYAHQGRAPDEVDVRALRTESILNSQATRGLGPRGVAALNGGGSPVFQIQTTIGRQAQRELYREEVRSEGPMMRTVRDMVRAGDMDAGFTGSAAVA